MEVVKAVFPDARRGEGMYESFYLRAVAPDEPVGVWVRYTVDKRPGEKPRGLLWCTVFDARKGRPWMHRLSTNALSAPQDAWIAVGDAKFGPGRAEGECGGTRWSLKIEERAPELRHLSRGWMYRAKLPRTKLTSPAPDARFEGTVELADGSGLSVDGWRGMVGHNWGAEHAERWVWLHGVGFAQDESAWLDVALGRIEVAGKLTPWIANGALSLGGARRRIGGLGRRGLRVRESTEGCTLTIPGADGVRIDAKVEVPRESGANWKYEGPHGGEHEVMNCSVARIELNVRLPDDEGVPFRLSTEHGGAYELGRREAHI